MLAEGTLFAMARPAKTQPKPRPQPTRRNPDMMFYGPQPAASALRRVVRTHRRPEQADRRRRPIEGDGPTVARGKDHRHGGGDLDVGRGQVRRAGAIPARRPAQGRGLSAHRQRGVRGHRSLPGRPDQGHRHRGAQADRGDDRAAPGGRHHRPPDRPGDRPAGPGRSDQLRQAADQSQPRRWQPGPDEPDRSDLPPDRPARRGDSSTSRPAARTSPTSPPA